MIFFLCYLDSKLLTLYHWNTSAFISNKWGQASTNHNAATIIGKSAWTHFHSDTFRPYPRFCTGLESCTAFNSHISLVTFSVEFLIFSLTFMKLRILKITDQFFHRMSLMELYDDQIQVMHLWQEEIKKWCCFFFYFISFY